MDVELLKSVSVVTTHRQLRMAKSEYCIRTPLNILKALK